MILRDAAHVQEEDAERARRRLRRAGKSDAHVAPLYGQQAVARVHGIAAARTFLAEGGWAASEGVDG